MAAKKVLVTGISGFLGAHVALALLRSGYRVRGSVRHMARAEPVRAALGAAGADVSLLEFCALDLRQEGGWTEAASGCQLLQHIASPFTLTMPAREEELIEPAVIGTRNAIQAALHAGHERMVLTSSLAAVDGGHANHDRALDTADWSELDGPHVTSYAKSKTLAEREAWSLVEGAGAKGRLAVVNPGTMLGPLLSDDPSPSVTVIQRMLTGKMPMAPDLILPYVDVRDVADAQVAAMISSGAGGARHILTNPAVALIEIANMLRPHFPERGRNFPKRSMPGWMAALVGLFDKSLRDAKAYRGIQRRYVGSSGQGLLGRPLISTEEAARAAARSLIDLKLA